MKRNLVVVLVATCIMFGAIGRSAVYAYNPITNPSTSPYRGGTTGPYCDWHGLPPGISCEVIVQPGTAWDVNQYMDWHWHDPWPTMVASLLFAMMCAPFGILTAEACAAIGWISGQYIRNTFRWATAYWHRGAPYPGICVRLMWWFVPFWPGVINTWIEPYEGPRCDFCPRNRDPHDCI